MATGTLSAGQRDDSEPGLLIDFIASGYVVDLVR